MSQRATTKDEQFVRKLYELAKQAGDPHAEIDRYVIGKAIGQNDKGVEVITRCLAQANFIKRGGENAFYLTPHGLTLAKSLCSHGGHAP